jgi:putative holliday junction resolvase
MPDVSARTLVALGFDFGQRRIGVASGDSLTLGARPLRAVPCLSNTAVDWSAIERCVREWDPAVFVVGVPYNMDGTPTALTEAATAFGTELSARHGRPVEFVDERLSSREAEDQLRRRRSTGERKKRVERGDIDAVAAAVLLEQWLRERGQQPRT